MDLNGCARYRRYCGGETENVQVYNYYAFVFKHVVLSTEPDK